MKIIGNSGILAKKRAILGKSRIDDPSQNRASPRYLVVNHVLRKSPGNRYELICQSLFVRCQHALRCFLVGLDAAGNGIVVCTQSAHIRLRQWIRRISIQVAASGNPPRIGLDVAAQEWIVKPKTIVVKLHLRIEEMSRKAQVAFDTGSRRNMSLPVRL